MSGSGLYVVPKSRGAGAFFVAMGLTAGLRRRYARVAVFKPIVEEESDEDIKTLIGYFGLSQRYEEAVGLRMDAIVEGLARHSEKTLMEALVSRYESLQEKYDAVLCLGHYNERLATLLEADPNLTLAGALGLPVAGVMRADGAYRSADAAVWIRALRKEGHRVFALFLNRAPDGLEGDEIEGVPCYPITYLKTLDRPTTKDLLAHLAEAGRVLLPGKGAPKTVERVFVAAMGVDGMLKDLKEGDAVVVSADRSDLLLALSALGRTQGGALVSAVVMCDGGEPTEEVMRVLAAEGALTAPLVTSRLDTATLAVRMAGTEARLRLEDRHKIERALGHFERHVDAGLWARLPACGKETPLTPLFLHRLYARAASQPKRVVLPESDDERVLEAAELASARGLAKIVLLGRHDEVVARARRLGFSLEGVEIVDPSDDSARLDRYADYYYAKRSHKGVTRQQALETVADVTVFGTLMVALNEADAMVSGAVHTTRETILPALRLIGMQPGVKLVSSLFFMGLESGVRVFADCAIVPDPDAEALAHIAVQSALTARDFGIEPRVALLSYASGESGVGADVRKVREATRLAKAMLPDVPIEGPMQYDAAVDEAVGRRKLPGSEVAGRATVLIFPDLNTGNNTYKAVQRATGATAIGPVLQGLAKPVNDLSRGCTVEDILNTIAVSAVQAQKGRA
ncbi:MAG: phosphate acetyltransferase [Epsilonproteobacteria bacterium]|nr:phosphate acetyltransferase [Campylobacterota bacterium]